MDQPVTVKPALRLVSGQVVNALLASPREAHYALDRPRCILGRSEQADLVLADSKSSREHIEIVAVDGAWRIRDLGSRNGTLLNGAKLADTVTLKSGDRIGVGLTEFEFVDESSRRPTRLRIAEGANAGQEFALADGRTVIGRRGGPAGIALDDERASRENTALAWVDGVWTVRDLGGRNGTSLGGELLPTGEAEAATPLRSGDRLRVGTTLLDFFDARVEERIGETILGYTIAGRAGHGSLGVTFRAANGAAVAIKFLDPGRARDPREVARFVAGARAQQRVTHGNVIKVIAAEANDGAPFAALEWQARGALAERLAGSEPMPAESVVAMARDVVRGLAAAAAKGLIHLGLRPRNILFNGAGQAAVGDFATCAPFDPRHPLVGPPSFYVSPEEARGETVDERSNQFSLGAVLYHALTGRVPFAGGDRGSVAQARLTQTLPPIRELAPTVPADLAKVVTRLLARQSSRRYGDWNEVLADLDAVANGSSGEVATVRGISSVLPPESSQPRVPAVQRPRSDSTTMGARPVPLAYGRLIKGGLLVAAVLVAVIVVLPLLGRRADVPGQGTVVQPAPAPAASPQQRGIFRNAGPENPVTPGDDSVRLSADTPSPLRPATPAPAVASKPSVAPQPSGRPRPLSSSAPELVVVPGDAEAIPMPLATVDIVAGHLAVAPGSAAEQARFAAARRKLGGAAPKLHPRLLVATVIGGPGDQRIDEVTTTDAGAVVAKGVGFIYTVSTASGIWTRQGDANQVSAPAADDPEAAPPGDPRTATDPRSSATWKLATQSAHPLMKQPALTGAGWQLWGWTWNQAKAQELVADSRGVALWPLHDGHLLVQCWADAANTTLVRDPRDLTRAHPALAAGALPRPGNGTSSLFTVVDREGAPIAATFVPGNPAATTDAWGRLYVATALPGASDAFGHGGRAGVGVFSADLGRIEFSSRLGGLRSGARGQETLGVISVRGNLLILAGTTAAADTMPSANSAQAGPGGGQDGLLIVIRLWD